MPGNVRDAAWGAVWWVRGFFFVVLGGFVCGFQVVWVCFGLFFSDSLLLKCSYLDFVLIQVTELSARS